MIEQLRQTVEALLRERETWKAKALTTGEHQLYRKVGLSESAPDFLIEAAQRAYRKHFHPDTQPAAQKADAERRFKETEAVFDEVWRLCGRS